jgi:hypothetical protein
MLLRTRLDRSELDPDPLRYIRPYRIQKRMWIRQLTNYKVLYQRPDFHPRICVTRAGMLINRNSYEVLSSPTKEIFSKSIY